MFKRFRSARSRASANPASQPPDSSKVTSSTIATSTASSWDLDTNGARSAQRLASPPGSFSNGHDEPDQSTVSSGWGLHVVHGPASHSHDIIFVHGLGGHSRNTWSKNHDPSYFWPELWLPLEPGVGAARISTFGYNANWRGGTKSVSNITDFAKELLYEMRFARDASGASLNMGEKPIIFVAHSMGGLVTKKAYLLGIHDETYQRVVQSISAIIFLSTPHRGTDLAKTLNRLLSTSFQSPKSFVSDLTKSSSAIEELNEQFRHLAPRLSIWSFYETLVTAIGPKKVMVLEKDSSVLGYSTEVSRPLHADHHNVCKFSSASDPNYVSLRNAIQSLVSPLSPEEDQDDSEVSDSTIIAATEDFRKMFKDCPDVVDDYDALLRHRVPGSCEWLAADPSVVSWMQADAAVGPRVLWYSAPPANGKSTLSAFMINQLEGSHRCCQYFFFNHSNGAKRSVANSLQSIAFQLAKDLPAFGGLLAGLSPDTLGLNSGDPRKIWRNVFERLVFKMNLEKPIFWVIDALDECDDSKILLECLQTLDGIGVDLRIMVFSRISDFMTMSFDRLSSTVPVIQIKQVGKGHNRKDLELFVAREMDHVRGSSTFKEQLADRIVTRSEGNFLWTTLVLKEISDCHTEDSIQEVVNEIPDDMNEYYHRMEHALLSSTRKPNKPLIRSIIEWCVCAETSLTLKELSHALRPDFPGLLDLKRTIQDTCGQFVRVDDRDQVSILHHTVREYFTRSTTSEFRIDARQTHSGLFAKTLSVFSDIELRWRLTQPRSVLEASEPFVFYAAVNWPRHLEKSHMDLTSLDILMHFFRGEAVLVWIQALAVLQRLDTLVKTSEILVSIAKDFREHGALNAPNASSSSELEVLDEWVIDLVKLVGKFGRHLATEPGIVFDVIPALSPSGSVTHRLHHNPDLGSFRVSGDDSRGWNDILARLALPEGTQVWEIACAGSRLVALTSASTIRVWDTVDFVYLGELIDSQPVTTIALSGNGTRLASYGLESTKLWSITPLSVINSVINPPNVKARTLTFSEDDNRLLFGGDDNKIRHIWCDRLNEGWTILHPSLLKEPARMDGTIINSPLCMAFNGTKTHVAVSYSGAPLSVWRLVDGRCINKCDRAKDGGQARHRMPSSSPTWFAVKRFCWNPVTGHILGVYKDGCIFKWHPQTNENVEVQWEADEIAVSPDGKHFVTSSSNGSVRLWGFYSFKPAHQSSLKDLVTGLAFSPEGRRFYDIRGSCINAWEPNALAHYNNADVSTIAETNVDIKNGEEASVEPNAFSVLGQMDPSSEFVTAVAPDPISPQYCVGFEDGGIQIFSKGQAEGTEVARFYNFLDVTHIKWSKLADLVVLADLAGDIQVHSVHRDDGGSLQLVSRPQPQVNMEDRNVQDILVQDDSSSVFISSATRCFVCRVDDGSTQGVIELQGDEHRVWLQHDKSLLAFGPRDVLIYSWDGLDFVRRVTYHEIASQNGNTDDEDDHRLQPPTAQLQQLELETKTDWSGYPEVVMRANITTDGQHIILVTSRETPRIANRRVIRIFPMELITAATDSRVLGSVDTILGFHSLPTKLASLVHMPLDIRRASRSYQFAFLNRQFWLCTIDVIPGIDLEVVGDDIFRHFFIPRDWVGTKSLDQCCLLNDGTLLWPKDERVVAIDCDLDRIDFVFPL